MQRKLRVNSREPDRRLAMENREKERKRELIYHLFTNQKMQKMRVYNRKRHDFRKRKKGVDKVGEDEYNSQCCREGRERERGPERERERSLKTI